MEESLISAEKDSDNNNENKVVIPEQGEVKKKNKKRAAVIVLSSLGLIFALICFSIINYTMAMGNAAKYDFRAAENEISVIPFSANLFPKETVFFKAGLDMISGKYEQAIKEDESIGYYNGSPQLLNEIKYREAAALANNNRYDEAVKIYNEISDYKDSKDLINDTTYKKASFELDNKNYQEALDILNDLGTKKYPGAYEKTSEVYYIWGCDLIKSGNYIEAYKTLLKVKNYRDTQQIIADTEEKIYQAGVSSYHKGDYTLALSDFETIVNYKRSNDYTFLISEHKGWAFMISSKNLWYLIGFEDAAEIIMSSDKIAFGFLDGNWEGDGANLKLEYTYDGQKNQISSNIPGISAGYRYKIVNGIIFSYQIDNPNLTTQVCKITVQSQDCIRVFSYGNYENYTLYRQ